MWEKNQVTLKSVWYSIILIVNSYETGWQGLVGWGYSMVFVYGLA